MRSATDTTRKAAVAGGWTVDPAASSVGFAIKHLRVATVHGHFEDFEGSVFFTEDLQDGVAEGSVRVASVRTGDAKRDEILRSPEFFDAEQFPVMTFRSTALRSLSAGRFEVTGDLTLRDTTERITLVGELGRPGTAPDGHEEVAIRVEGKVDRTRFGMPFDHGASSALLGKRVKLELSLTARRPAG
jgi:polyisoprenoid-binding protein YceI